MRGRSKRSSSTARDRIARPDGTLWALAEELAITETVEARAEVSGDDRSRPLTSVARFLIVTHPDFLSAANALKAHKEMLGISTAVVTTQTISGTGAAATDTQIRSWVADYYNERAVKPKWLLLLGDAEKLPTHYDQNNWYTSSKNAGDIWYGQFMPGATAETVPAIGIGRFPVDTLSQADTMVAKVMAFENFPPAMGNGTPNAMQNFYQRLTFASFFEGSGSADLRAMASHLKALSTSAASSAP